MIEYPPNALSFDELNKHIHSFQPFVAKGGVVRSPLVDVGMDLFTQCHEVVDVSCLPSDTECEFKGSVSDRQLLLMELREYTGAFITRSRMHDFKLYLSQHCLYSSDTNTTSSSSSLMRKIYDAIRHRDVHVVDFLMKSQDIQQVNLWMNMDTSVSALHYDSFHNILYVDQGSKRVTLVSPEHSQFLSPGASYSSSAGNHSTCASNSLIDFSLTCTLQAGDSLFIPEGWWHRVESQEYTVALNYWFKSPLYSILHEQKQMRPYLLRSLVLELTAEEVNRRQERSMDEIRLRREKGELIYIYNSIDRLKSHVQNLYQTIRTLEEGAAPSSMQSEQFSSLVKIKTELELEFVSCTLAEMKESWLLLTKIEAGGEDEMSHKIIHRIFLSLEATSAYRLLQLWDSTEGQWTPHETRNFFGALLQSQAKCIQNYLIYKSDVYRNQVCQDLLTELNVASQL